MIGELMIIDNGGWIIVVVDNIIFIGFLLFGLFVLKI